MALGDNKWKTSRRARCQKLTYPLLIKNYISLKLNRPISITSHVHWQVFMQSNQISDPIGIS